jgi:succinate dehydrogenase/fumarate reductase flavoprotein subunit
VNVNDSASDSDRKIIQDLLENTPGESFGQLRSDLGSSMNQHLAVYRNEEGMQQALKNITDVKERFNDVYVADKTKTFNTNLMFTLEMGFMIECAESIALSAIERTESRGAHTREDMPERDDENWLKHILVTKKDEGHEISYKDVVITDWQPTVRQY